MNALTNHVGKKGNVQAPKKNHKAFLCLHEQQPRSSEENARAKEKKIVKKLNHQMKILFWTSPMLALFWPVLAPPLVCSIPPSHPRAFSSLDFASINHVQKHAFQFT